MKRSLLFFAACLAPLILAPKTTARPALNLPALVTTPAHAPSGQAQDKNDAATLRRAAKLLRSKGYAEESQRLMDIAAQWTTDAKAKKKKKNKAKAVGAPKAEKRAAKLLKADFTDKAVRVKALRLVANGYKRAGDKPNAEAMTWFADIGKSQLSGDSALLAPTPKAATSKNGNIMERLTEIIRDGGKLQRDLGNLQSARVHETLATFYANRSRGEAEANAPTRARPLNAIGYGGEAAPAPKSAQESERKGPGKDKGGEEAKPKAESDQRRRALARQRKDIEKRLAEVRARLGAAKAELEAIRAGGKR